MITPPPPVFTSESAVVVHQMVGHGWKRLRLCESRNRYHINTHNGYYGAYQFSMGTWRAMGGKIRPDLATVTHQDLRALRLFRQRGSSPWPVCGQYLDQEAGQG